MFVKLRFLKATYSGWAIMTPLPTLILGEERNQYYLNLMQFLRNLSKIIASFKKKFTKIVKIEEVKIHIF